MPRTFSSADGTPTSINLSKIIWSSVGVGLFLIITAVLVIFKWQRRKKRKSNHPPDNQVSRDFSCFPFCFVLFVSLFVLFFYWCFFLPFFLSSSIPVIPSQFIIVVNGGKWLWSPANIKGANKLAKIYVRRATIVHTILFCVYTLYMSYATKTFLLVSSSVISKQLLCNWSFRNSAGNWGESQNHKWSCWE